MKTKPKLGTKTKFGRVAGILYIGEKYYFLIKNKTVCLMPASLIEMKKEYEN